MKLERFSKNVDIMAENFGFKIKNEEWMEMLFRTIGAFSKDDMNYGFQEMCKITQEDWNKRYGYGGKPAIADWVNFFRLRAKDQFRAERQAKEEIAMENAKNGVRTAKVVNITDTVDQSKIENLIKNLSTPMN